MLTKDPKQKPYRLPLRDIILEAIIELDAVPTIMIAVGRVAKDFISIKVEPMIPLSKTVTTGGVEEKIWENNKIIKLRLNTECQYRQILTKQLLIKSDVVGIF